MSNETLKAFYYGNLTPENRQIIRGSAAARASAELSSAEKAMTQALPPELKPALDRLTKAQDEMELIMAESYYIDGFKTGARFMMDILDDSRENLKPIIE